MSLNVVKSLQFEQLLRASQIFKKSDEYLHSGALFDKSIWRIRLTEETHRVFEVGSERFVPT